MSRKIECYFCHREMKTNPWLHLMDAKEYFCICGARATFWEKTLSITYEKYSYDPKIKKSNKQVIKIDKDGNQIE
jgi:hypothetical protein